MAKDTIKKYSVQIGRDNYYTFTAHSTKQAARKEINETLNPCLVEIIVGGRLMYDAFPLGHPLAEEHEIIERCEPTSIGYRWVKVKPRDFQEVDERIFQRDTEGY